jgi:hypothetical protein
VALAILQKVLGLRFWVLGTPMEEEKINSPGLQPWDLETRKNYCSCGFSHIAEGFGFAFFGFRNTHGRRKNQ